MTKKTIQKEKCKCCGHIISERKIALYRGIIKTLWRVYQWAKVNGHEFSRKDIKHLFINENDTARFGDLIMFGGLVYRPEDKNRGYYGLNMERCENFFKRVYRIPLEIWKNPVTKELRKENYVTVDQIPSIIEFLDEDQFYVAEYRENKSFNRTQDNLFSS